jgi:membrane-associated phospholipid phosphatase
MSMKKLHATPGSPVVEVSIIAAVMRPSNRALWAVGVVGCTLTVALHAMVLSHRGLWFADGPVARWSARLSSPGVVTAATYTTRLGSTVGVITAAVVVAILEHRRGYGRSVVAYLTVVIAGQAMVVNATKAWLGRARPQISVLARTVSSSFPSGHTTAAAAAYACIALLLSRGRSVPIQISFGAIGVAVALAVAATRVVLGVHWLTDVAAGLALGWAVAAFGTLAFSKALGLV